VGASEEIMQVTVSFFGPQKQETGLDKYEIQSEENMCVVDVIGVLEMWFPEISLGEIALVNGKKSNTETKLKDMDELMFIPSIGGG